MVAATVKRTLAKESEGLPSFTAGIASPPRLPATLTRCAPLANGTVNYQFPQAEAQVASDICLSLTSHIPNHSPDNFTS